MASENDIRKGVRDGIIDAEASGLSFFIIIVECAVFGYFMHKGFEHFFVEKDGWSENLANWVGWGSGVLFFILVSLPKVAILVSIFWALMGYTIARAARVEFVEEPTLMQLISFSSSPVPYVVGLVVFIFSWAIHDN